jgi:hypothetical protein
MTLNPGRPSLDAEQLERVATFLSALTRVMTQEQIRLDCYTNIQVTIDGEEAGNLVIANGDEDNTWIATLDTRSNRNA